MQNTSDPPWPIRICALVLFFSYLSVRLIILFSFFLFFLEGGGRKFVQLNTLYFKLFLHQNFCTAANLCRRDRQIGPSSEHTVKLGSRDIFCIDVLFLSLSMFLFHKVFLLWSRNKHIALLLCVSHCSHLPWIVTYYSFPGAGEVQDRH